MKRLFAIDFLPSPSLNVFYFFKLLIAKANKPTINFPVLLLRIFR